MTTRPKKLLNIDANAKTVKGQKKGFMTAVLYLAPADLSGYQVCPMASEGCKAACLNTAGRAGIVKAGETTNPIQLARIAKTRWYFEDRAGFMAKLIKEIGAFVRKAEAKGLTPCVRLNGTSDIPWERVAIAGKMIDGEGLEIGHASLFDLFPDVIFYDYTKIPKRALAFARGEMPRNYHLTFSLTEANDQDALAVLKAGGNVAAVFKTAEPIETGFWAGLGQPFPVIDGDETDLRFLDEYGAILGLKAKGKARHDTSGFVRA